MITLVGESVIQFVAQSLRTSPERISPTSRLREDLRVDGDDAYDLLVNFAQRFGVKSEGLEFADHFGPEASLDPFSLLRGKKRIPITVQDLIDSAATGAWHIGAKRQQLKPS